MLNLMRKRIDLTLKFINLFAINTVLPSHSFLNLFPIKYLILTMKASRSGLNKTRQS